MANLNPVETTVTVAGQAVHFVKLELSQAFNQHHHFTIEVNYEEFGGKWMDDALKMIKFIGQDVNITMKHRETGEENLFNGIISHLSHSGYHGQKNSIIISGCSPTIKLDGKKTMYSFMDMPLKQIVDEAVGNSGNGGEVTSKPVFGGKIDYMCQYDETCFEFLNRLSSNYYEYFFYDGTTCNFGRKSNGSATVTYDVDMTYFDLSAQLAPPKFNRYHYFVHDDKELDEDAPGMVPGVRGYGEVALNRANEVYTSEANLPLSAVVNTKKELDDLIKAEKGQAAGQMLLMKGNTHTCKIKIGSSVTFKLPNNMDVAAKVVDTFLITQVTHNIDQAGRYTNSFTAILDGIESIPMAPMTPPIANPQMAVVKSNEDPKKLGRIKVQTQWQKKVGKTTNWIRVQTPDAGKSDKVPNNRGLVFIPEKDDLVMLGFEYGDPSRPYVAGSIFSEKVSQGGGVDNNIKTIITRSGHTIRLDDTKGKELIQIFDIKGNFIEIDSVADTMSLFSNKVINIESGIINLTAKQNINAMAGAMVNVAAGATATFDARINTIISAGMNVSVNALKSIGIVGMKDVKVSSAVGASLALDAKGKGKLTAKKNVDITTQGKLNMNANKDAKIKSKKMHVEGSSKAVVKGSKVQVK